MSSKVVVKDSKQTDALSVDVLIIGGGINGSGLARELSLRGVSVMLVEKGDFGSGTSSASSKLAHGGLRYLESFEFGLVKEALSERYYLLKNARHLVKPLRFVFPIYKHTYSRWKIGLGLWLYDWLCGGKKLAPYQPLKQSDKRLSILSQQALQGGFSYSDAQMDDARLVVENIKDAANNGAICLNYAKVTALKAKQSKISELTVSPDPKGWTGHRLVLKHGTHSSTNAADIQVKPRFVVSASGPWTDEVLQMMGNESETHQLVLKSKGIHVLLKGEISDHAYVMPSTKDGRVVFVMPWAGHTLVGTTDSAVKTSADNVEASPQDIAYLLGLFCSFFSKSLLKKHRVIGVFSGIRPLMNKTSGSLQAASRSHHFIQIKENFVAIIGGKYTTYRAITESLANVIFKKFGREDFRAHLTQDLPFQDSCLSEKNLEFKGNIPEKYLKRICKHDQSLESTLADTWLTAAHVVYFIEEEYARTIMDILRRRTTLYFDVDDASQFKTLVKGIGLVFMSHLGMDAKIVEEQMNGVFNQKDRDRACIDEGLALFNKEH